MPSSELAPATQTETTYDGFVSYSHAADGLLAPRLQSGLQRFAKPWWKRRAVRIFRDEASLAANPHLWSSITKALDDSSWFVLLLSPEAARSPWVNQEIEYWKANRDPERILPVLTGGTFTWDGSDVAGTSVPDQLKGAFAEEPRWVDVRFASQEDQLDLKNPNFADAVADIASALRGIAKDDLASEEVRQHRRTIRTAWAAGALVLTLGTLAAVAAVMASRNAQEAERQATIAQDNADEAANQRDAALTAEEEAQRQARLARTRELGSSAIEVLEEDPRLARILALEAVDVAGNTEDLPLSVVNALWRSLYEDRLVREIDNGLPGFTPIFLSKDGSRFVLSSDEGKVVVAYSAPTVEELWRYSDPGADMFGVAAISPDGNQVAVGVVNQSNPDAGPTRVMILDGSDGSVLETFDYSYCPSIEPWGWSPDGTRFVSNHGVEPCPREDAPGGIWAEVRDTATWESLGVIESVDPWVAEPIFDAEGNLYLFGIQSPVVKFSSESYEQVATFEAAYGLGDVSPDGSMLATYTPARSGGLRLTDTATDSTIDNLAPMPGQPQYGNGIRFSMDGSRLIVATEGNDTVVWETALGGQAYVLPSGPSHAAFMSPDGRWAYTSHPNGVVRVWDLGPIRANTTSSGDLDGYPWVNANSFQLGEDLASVQTVDAAGDCVPFCSAIRLFDLDTGVLRDDIFEGYGNVPLPDGSVVYSDAEFNWWVYDPDSGQSELWVECQIDDTGGCAEWGRGRVEEVLVSVDSPEVALRVTSQDRSERLVVVDPVSLEPIEEVPSEYLIRAFSSEWVLSDSFSFYVVLDRVTGEEIFRDDVSATFFELSPSKKTAAMLTLEGDLAVVHLGSWTKEFYDLGLDQIRGLGFGPADQMIALAEPDALHLLDLSSGLVTQTIPLPGVSDIYWLNNDEVIIGTSNGMWGTLSLGIDDLIENARNVAVPRAFTQQECATYRIDPCPADD